MSSKAKNLVVLLGPTAVGKSAAAVRLALDLNGEVINCDSMQVYRGFDIGTDKPSSSDRERVRHHLLDICDPSVQFTAAKFVEKALEAVEIIRKNSRLPLITGGTGLYLKALLDGLFPETFKDPAIRSDLEQEVRTRGLDDLHDELLKVDALYARKIGRGDRIRIVRALEVFRATGIPLSEHFSKTQSPTSDYNVIRVGLHLEREPLCRLIESRVDRMFERGIVEEVKRLLSAGISENAPPFRALGYKQVLSYLHGSLTLVEAIERTKTDTRRYAKRQMTWFRKMQGIRWFTTKDYESLKHHIMSHMS